MKNRFETKIIRSDTCWLWNGSTTSFGYGKFSTTRSKWDYAHRVGWTIYRGIIPKGYNVLHGCDNPSCVNPNHLFIGTAKDNISDCVNKKRHQFGEKHYAAKLSIKDVVNIRQSIKKGTRLAKYFGVSPSRISLIRNNKSWCSIMRNAIESFGEFK